MVCPGFADQDSVSCTMQLIRFSFLLIIVLVCLTRATRYTVDELKEHFASDNPTLDFAITTEYSDCNTCSNGACTIMGCDTYWKTTLHVRSKDGTPVGRMACSPFVREWTVADMRERWRRRLTSSLVPHANWPFEQAPESGDVPSVVE